MSHLMFEHPADEPVLKLEPEQSLTLLRNTRHGRLAFVDDGRVEIFPINYALDGQRLVFRSAPGSKLVAAENGLNVAFEADGILADQAWSVVVRGHAELLTDEEDIAQARLLGVTPWVPTHKDYWAAITISEITGRHFIFGRQPERGDEREFRHDPEIKTHGVPENPDPTRMTRD